MTKILALIAILFAVPVWADATDGVDDAAHVSQSATDTVKRTRELNKEIKGLWGDLFGEDPKPTPKVEEQPK